MDTISFKILDDLRSCYSDCRVIQKRKSVSGVPKKPRRKTVRAKVASILKELKTRGCDPTGYYVKGVTDRDIDSITDALLSDGYYVLNRYEKYYVVAFALNYTRFEVFSKDCDKELITWPEDGPIVNVIDDPDYNENPVIRLMRALAN